MEKACVNITKEKSKEIGKRLKAEAHKRNIKNQDMADLIGYSSGKQISPIYQGRFQITEDRIDILCKEWGVRKNYLLCIDDWETEEEMLIYSKNIDINSLKACLTYLETLGLRLTPYVSSYLPLTSIKANWEMLIDYFTEETIDSLLCEYDFTLPPADFRKQYFSKNVVVHWKKALDLNISFEEIGKQNNLSTYITTSFDDLDFISIDASKSTLKVNTEYIVGYKIYYKDEYYCDCSIKQLQKFITILDAFTTCSINTILINQKQ